MNIPFTAMLHKSLLHAGPVGSLVCDLALTSVSGPSVCYDKISRYNLAYGQVTLE